MSANSNGFIILLSTFKAGIYVEDIYICLVIKTGLYSKAVSYFTTLWHWWPMCGSVYPTEDVSIIQLGSVYPTEHVSRIQHGSKYPIEDISRIQRGSVYPTEHVSRIQRGSEYSTEDSSIIQWSRVSNGKGLENTAWFRADSRTNLFKQGNVVIRFDFPRKLNPLHVKYY